MPTRPNGPKLVFSTGLALCIFVRMTDDLKSMIGRWFGLTREERRLLATIIAIATVGMIARYVHLSRQTADVYAPAHMNLTESGQP